MDKQNAGVARRRRGISKWWSILPDYRTAILSLLAASPDLIPSAEAYRFARHQLEVDLASIRAPTLVLHRTGDRDMNIEEGRYLAHRIPKARFVELPGIDHLPFAGDQESVLREIEQFIRAVAPQSSAKPRDA